MSRKTKSEYSFARELLSPVFILFAAVAVLGIMGRLP